MQIGELAKHAGVTVQAVRFYEREGLLPSPPRKDSGYRIYSPGDLRRLQFVQQAKRLGFSLAEIKSVLQMRADGTSPCKEVISIAQRHLVENRRANPPFGSISQGTRSNPGRVEALKEAHRSGRCDLRIDRKND